MIILLGLALAQTLAYPHNAVTIADSPVGAQRRIVNQAAPSDDWPTYHRDTVRSGYDPTIPQFTSAQLNWQSVTLDGDIYAEPLIVGTNVIVATENNSLYDLNATSGKILWHTNFGTPVDGGTLPCGDISPSGITSTPVIDVSGRTIFAVAFLQSPSLHHQLFAVDLDTGNEKYNLTIDPPGANPTVEQQRAALALTNGYVYVPYGGLDGDCGQYHGWLAATNTNGQGPTLSYQVPTGRAGAIWGGGDGLAVDQSGSLLFATGNSDATSTFDWGDAVIKLSSASSTPPVSLLDWFAPSNWAQLNHDDLDLGSTEPVILNSNLLFQIGKDGVGYLLNATKLGGVGGQVYSSQVCNGSGAFGGLAYSSPYLIVPCSNRLEALNLNLGSNPSFTVAWNGPSYLTGPPIIAGNAVWDVDVSDGSIYALGLTNGQTIFHNTIGSVPTHFNSVSAGDGQILVSANQQVLAYLPTTTSFTYSLSNSGGITVTQGSSGLNTITASLQTGTAQSVTLSCTGGVPSGASCGFNPASGNPTFSSTLTIRTSSSTPTGSYTITVNGNPLTTAATSFTLTVNAPQPFGQISSLISANANSAWIVMPDYTAGSGSVTHIGASKCGGVAVAFATDVYAATYLFGALTSPQNEVLDTNSAYVSQSESCGQPKTSTSQPIVTVAGPLVNEVVRYYEASTAPLYYDTSTGCIVRRDTGADVDCSSPTPSNDVFVMDTFKDAAGRTVFIIYGRAWIGTLAGYEYLVNFVLKNSSSYTKSWYVYNWQDATSGVSANSIPDPGDMYTQIAAGP